LNTNLRYRPDIDGLRALAVLPVIFFHAGLGCSGGFVGVDIFFVISGFLITSLILKEINDGSFSLVRFCERRIRRILPALVVVVIAVLALGWFLYLPEDFELIGESVVAQAALLSNIFFWETTRYFTVAADTKPLLHCWSLAVEEQFYVLFPLLLIFLARYKRFSVARTLFWLGAGSFALCVAGSYARPSATFYLLPTRAWELMAGALLAALPVRPSAQAWLNQTAGWCGLGLILYPIFYYTRATRFPGLAAVPPCLGAALILFSGGIKPTLVGRALALKPVVFVGLISYPLYLWHWPLLVFTKYSSREFQSRELNAVLLIVSVALAIVTWKWIEMPFRRRLLCPRSPQVFAFAGCSMLILLIVGGGIYLKHGMPSRLPAEALMLDGYRNDHAFRNEITLQQAEAGQFVELGAQNRNQPVKMIIWGDSHAMAVTSVLDELCRRFSVRGVEATHSSTAPILDYNSDYNDYGLHEKSLAFAQSVVKFISQKHVKIVILAAHWRRYGPPDLVDSRLAATVRALLAGGASVYVLKDAPEPDFDVPRVAALTVAAHGDLAPLAVSPDKYDADNHNYESIFKHLSQIGATVLDTPKYFLNSNGRYDVVRDDKALYCDQSHLSVEGARLLTPMFEPLFRAK
jgi:peptidoglycan/LPS O-acetylase OafA/YrhL